MPTEQPHISFIQDSARIWNNAPKYIKDCNSIYKAKKNIKKFVHTLPLWKRLTYNMYIYHYKSLGLRSDVNKYFYHYYYWIKNENVDLFTTVIVK